MHISPPTDEHDSRLMPCSSPLRCPYRNNQDVNSAGMPLVHGDKAFIESAIKHAARKDAEISAALSEQIRNIELGVDSGLTSPEFKEWVKQKLWEKAHPDIRELDGFGFATDDEWAPWAGNTDMTPITLRKRNGRLFVRSMSTLVVSGLGRRLSLRAARN